MKHGCTHDILHVLHQQHAGIKINMPSARATPGCATPAIGSMLLPPHNATSFWSATVVTIAACQTAYTVFWSIAPPKSDCISSQISCFHTSNACTLHSCL